MKITIKQNWSNGFWFVRPACDRSRMVLRASEMDNQMIDNAGVAALAGRQWLQAFLCGEHPASEWHEIEVPANHPLNVRASALIPVEG